MELPKEIMKHKETGTYKITMPTLEKDITYTIITKYDPCYCSNSLTMTQKINGGRDYKNTKKDINKLNKIIKQLFAHGWKVKKDEAEADSESN